MRNTNLQLPGILSLLSFAKERVEQLEKCLSNIKDVWEFLGKRKEAQYSWDTMRNTNLQLPGKFKPRMRFDRVYIRESQPSRLVPTSFNLIGIEKVPGTQSFPSDHWGILTLFEMDG